MGFSEENLPSPVSLPEAGTAPGLKARAITMLDIVERKIEGMSLDIIDLRNIAEVLSLNILDIPTAPAPSLLPFRVKWIVQRKNGFNN